MSATVVLSSTARLLSWPIRSLLDAATLRQLRRAMPGAHRLWVVAESSIRPENDAEYLARLRGLARDRFARRLKGRARTR